MRIILDLQSLQTSGSRNRGVGRYSLALAKAMIGQGGSHEFLIALNHSFPETIIVAQEAFAHLVPPENILLFRIPGPIAELNLENRWRCHAAELIREHFLQQLQPDWVHVSHLFEGAADDAVTSINRFAHLNTAVTLYDLIPYIYSDHYLANPAAKSWYMRKLEHLRRADVLFAISEHSRQEAIGELGLAADRVVHVSADADPSFRPLEFDEGTVHGLLARHGLKRDFVMYTGGIDYRKNIERLIEAYASLPAAMRASHQLAIVCSVVDDDRRRLSSLATRLGLAPDQVVLTGYVSDEDLVALLNLCVLFVFPSFREGFGLPALEAMRCGAPVIGSNQSSIPEVIGLDSALFDPFSSQSIASKVYEALANKEFRRHLREHSRTQAAKFSWNASAKLVLESFESQYQRIQQAKHPTLMQVGSLRPRLAYVSPLPPEQSGIADYSAELLPELADYYEIDLITDLKKIEEPWLAANFRRRSVAEFEDCAGEYDRVLYHFGNSAFHSHMFSLLARYPGTVVLHDFFLSGILHYMEALTPGSASLRQALYRSHGYAALRDWVLKGPEEAVWKYPCSLEVIQAAQGVIVNSEYALRLADGSFGATLARQMIYTPQLRRLPKSVNRLASREVLRLPEGAFVTCSFGFLGPTKLNHRLLDAWLGSDLARDERCYLVFVGEGHGDVYAQALLQRINASGFNLRVKITGYASAETYQHYLAAADVAVQLRTRSRGGTDRSPLDCLAWGLPTIVNNHGTMADLPGDIVVKLPDEFADSSLAGALVQLHRDRVRREAVGGAASKYMSGWPGAADIARLYAEAIESFAQASPISHRRRLLAAVAALHSPRVPLGQDLIQIAEAVRENSPPLTRPQLLVDISELVRRDAGTGIQRVTRNVLRQLVVEAPPSYRVEPVYRTEGVYRYARRFMAGFVGAGELGLEDAPVGVALGDKFLGLDLDLGLDDAARNWLRHNGQRGLNVYFACYDLLPLLRPDCFPLEGHSLFERWLEGVTSLADGVVCISRTVAAELGKWLDGHPVARERPLRIGYFHLGADAEATPALGGASDDGRALLGKLASRDSILMVGTLEPRKGYAQALEAFEALWAAGEDFVVVIVGKQGWMVEGLAERLRTHPEAERRLMWIENASDGLLTELYRNVSALLVASEGEGFGLPLAEAARHGLPIIARDLAAFREVAGDHAFYFSGREPRDIADALLRWLPLYHTGAHPRPDAIPWVTWRESAESLKRVLLEEHWYGTWMPSRARS